MYSRRTQSFFPFEAPLGARHDRDACYSRIPTWRSGFRNRREHGARVRLTVGRPDVIRRAGGGGEEVIPSKTVTTLRKGDRLVIETAGGGGYGDPRGRTAEQVGEDVRNGKVSEEAARAAYGQAKEP